MEDCQIHRKQNQSFLEGLGLASFLSEMETVLHWQQNYSIQKIVQAYSYLFLIVVMVFVLALVLILFLFIALMHVYAQLLLLHLFAVHFLACIHLCVHNHGQLIICQL